MMTNIKLYPACPGGGGGEYSLKHGVMEMLKGFEVHFHQFWYTYGVVLKLFQVY